MKINWFSPLPPAKTGIGLYTDALIPALRERAELTLWTDQRAWDERLNQEIAVRRFDPARPPWRELNSAGMNIYNIGNNILHEGIWQVSRQHAGMVILHDACLQQMFSHLYLRKWRETDAYRKLMRHFYGEDGARATEEFLRGELTTDQLSSRFPLTPLALENALCCVVHNHADANRTTAGSLLPFFCLSLSCSTRALYPRAALAAKVRANVPPYQVITFGFLGPNRRLESFLEAWSALAQKSSFRLIILGQVWDRDHLRKRIRDLGLEGMAEIRGYVDDDELRAQLTRSDLAINLRYPTMGEASISQLLMWEYGLPALVTKSGWYSNLPADSVSFVRPEYEKEDIRRTLLAFLAAPERFAEMGLRGRENLEREHLPDTYANSLMHLIHEMRDSTMRRGNSLMAARSAAAMRECIIPTADKVLRNRVIDAIGELGPVSGSLEYPGVRCAQRKRFMERYERCVQSYRQAVREAGGRTTSQPEGAADALDRLRTLCQTARADLGRHEQAHGC